MTGELPSDSVRRSISRRNFVRVGGAALATGAVLGEATAASTEGRLFPSAAGGNLRVQRYRTLGRTGFQVSDIGMGTVPLRESAVVRYAYDRGVNYFDTAEGYGNGAAERAIGEAMQHMDRARIFLTSKCRVREGDSEATIVERVRTSLERLRTDYVDAYSIHGPETVEALSHPGYHAAMETLKAEGRVRFTGISYHGPQRPDEGSMGDVLTATAEDGRFDLVLMVYNFLNHGEADRILATCKANNVATTAMKTAPGALRYDPVDREDLTEEQERYVRRFTQRGSTRESALERLETQALRQKDLYERTRPFAERYGVQTEEQLRLGSIHWVIQNPDMHTACIAFTDFELVDKVVALSGTPLTAAEQQLLAECELALADQYCRHGCHSCFGSCPSAVPVSTVMRYVYYYEGQGREKLAMKKYADLEGGGARACLDCRAPCEGSCPYRVDIQLQMLRAHSLLTLA